MTRNVARVAQALFSDDINEVETLIKQTEDLTSSTREDIEQRCKIIKSKDALEDNQNDEIFTEFHEPMPPKNVKSSLRPIRRSGEYEFEKAAGFLYPTPITAFFSKNYCSFFSKSSTPNGSGLNIALATSCVR